VRYVTQLWQIPGNGHNVPRSKVAPRPASCIPRNGSDSPIELSNTLLYQRWTSGAERMIWHQVSDRGMDDDDLREEFEEIPLSFLKDLETRKAKNKESQQQKQNGSEDPLDPFGEIPRS
jgi:hypothetical protein